MSDNEVVYNSDLEEWVERNLQWNVNDENDEMEEESWYYAVFSALKKTSLVKVIGGLLLFGSGIVVGAASNALMTDYGSHRNQVVEPRRMSGPQAPKQKADADTKEKADAGTKAKAEGEKAEKGDATTDKGPKDAAKDDPKDAAKDGQKDAAKDDPKDAAKDGQKDAAKDGPKVDKKKTRNQVHRRSRKEKKS